jgi:nucleotide-binding universal stress UspA family protein
MRPFRTVLFGADFSENSVAAFRAACSLAVENKTRLFVLHVAVPSWVPERPVEDGQQFIQVPANEAADAPFESLKRTMRELYSPHHAIDVEYQTRRGKAAEEILRMARKIGSDLIVMGTHGLTGLMRVLAGSVAIAVVRGASCPVLALRSGAFAREADNIRVLVHPTDFSDGSAAALRVARSLARDRAARLILLHVAPLPVVLDGGTTDQPDLSNYEDMLEAARERTDGPDLKYPVETWSCQGHAPDAIVRTAGEIGCDLIVMGTHGRTGLARLLMGNTAESVLPEAHCPVMVVKTPPKESPASSDSQAERTLISAC